MYRYINTAYHFSYYILNKMIYFRKEVFMKNIIIGISTIFLGIILTFTVMSVNASMTVKNDATNALADSVEESVENCMEDKSYSIASKDEFVSDLVQNLSVGVENTSDLKVDIVKADKEKGIMSIRVESTFLYPNGSKGTATTKKTVIFEQNYKKRHTVPVKYLKYIPDDPTTISVNEALLQPNSDYYQTHPNMLLKEYTLTTGDKFVIPDEIPTSPSGSQFLYWKTETNKIITKDTIVDDSYIPEGQNTLYLVPFFKDEQQTYTVKFNGNGATSGTMPDQECIIGSGTTLMKNTFEKKYKISLNLNGGRLTDTGELATYEVQAKFLGWSTDPNNSTVTIPDENATDIGTDQSTINLYAVWAPAPVNLPNAMKGDSNLSKWMADNKDYNAGDRVEITKDTDFTAAYNTKMCAVRFSTIGVLGADQFISVAQGTDITLPDTTLTGFACTGWYDDDKKVGNIGDKVTVNSDMSLTAKFIESKTTINYYDANKKLIKTENISYGEHISSDMPSINYTITFDTNGADAIAPMEQTNNFECWVDDEKKEYQAGTVLTSTKPTLNLYAVVNKGYLMLPQNSKAGYQFKGWYLDGGRLGVGGATYQFTRSCTVKAEYQRTVTFTVKYGNGAPDSVYTGSTGDTYSIGIPTRDNYTFTGWHLDSGDCSISEDRITFGQADSVITAQWKLNTHSLYMSNIAGYGTADLYINGNLYSAGITSINMTLPHGTNYTVAVRGNGTYVISGTSTFTGTLTSDVSISPNFNLNQVPVTVYEYITDSNGNNASLYKTWYTSNYTVGSTQTVYSQRISGYQTPGAKTITVYAGSTVTFYHTKNTATVTVKEYIENENGYNATYYTSWTTTEYTIGSTQSVTPISISGYETPNAQSITVKLGSTISFYHKKLVQGYIAKTTYHGYTYYLFDCMDWDAAVNKTNSIHGHMYDPSDSDTDNYIANWAYPYCTVLGDGVWVDGIKTDYAGDGIYSQPTEYDVWCKASSYDAELNVSSEKMYYQNWAPGQPDNPNSEKYIELWVNHDAPFIGHWNSSLPWVIHRSPHLVVQYKN
jgi:uncharacterized repeat protein (TIGR02543 family)